jgi:ketosteroid isomerase-like protein
MSKENINLVRTIHEGWARGDFRVGTDLRAPDYEWKQRPDAVEPGSLHGAAVGTALRRLFEVWEDYRIEAEEYIDAGDEIVVVSRVRGIGRGSRVELDEKLALVWRVRDGELVSTEVFADRQEALEAVGRSE